MTSAPLKICTSLLLSVGFLLASCDGGSATGAVINGGDGAKALGSASPAPKSASGFDKPAQTDNVETLSFTDRSMLKQAETSCRDGDVGAFFDAFIQSEAVRQKYTAPKVSIVGHSDLGFPILMVDHYRKPAQPSRPGADDEFVEIVISHSQSNQIAVEWTRVRYSGTVEGGDDRGDAMNPDGTPYRAGQEMDGKLLFEPTKDCWQLVSDTRRERDGAR